MPRYLIEREFPEDLDVPLNAWGAERCRRIVEANLEEGVTWLASYIDRDLRRAFCLYEGPTPEAIRAASGRNHLPVTRISEVRVFEPEPPSARPTAL
jgi:hypothetical protein